MDPLRRGLEGGRSSFVSISGVGVESGNEAETLVGVAVISIRLLDDPSVTRVIMIIMVKK